jgi:hypothetical protein
MRWDAVIDLLGHELERIVRPVPKEFFQGLVGYEAVAELLFDKNKEHREVLDAAISQFARSAQWPELDDEQIYLLNLRLLCALVIMNVLLVQTEGGKVVPQPQASRRAVIEWLLNATWNEWRWDTWLKLTALRAQGAQDTFYGLDPQSR